MQCAKHKTSDGEQRKSGQVSEGTTENWQRTGWREYGKQPVRWEQNVESGA